ncbi:MAG TPA: MFS transporter [Bacteroidota bacterium]|nr:MFS transporter [Bacteroidota bacterium]
MADKTPTFSDIVKNTIREVRQPFIDLFKASQALWGINVSYLIEGITYFGIVGLLAIYFNDFVGLNDIQAGQMVGVLTAGITLSMLFLGATVDMIGPRKAILISLFFMLIGRIILTLSPTMFATKGLWSTTHLVALAGLLGVIIGYGIYQPACYAAVKYFTTEKEAAMGYAMLYALMNLGGFLPGLISPPVRHSHGILGVFWVYVFLTAVGIVVVAILLNKKSVTEAIQKSRWNNNQSVESAEEKKPIWEQIKFYIRNFPFRDKRFLFFIFILIPVQTLFAHNWLTLPQYFSRAFTGVVSENFEFFVNFNPILIFILTPAVAALTTKSDTYDMMIIGTFVMASPTFFLALGPSIYTAFAYLIIMTIGEAMWQPRFLQWVAEIAPKDMTGIYMGIGQFPWFLTKVITSLYSGWFLMKYCPANTPPDQMHTEVMWLIYGLIAIISPVALLIARRWMKKDFKVKHGE